MLVSDFSLPLRGHLLRSLLWLSLLRVSDPGLPLSSGSSPPLSINALVLLQDLMHPFAHLLVCGSIL